MSERRVVVAAGRQGISCRPHERVPVVPTGIASPFRLFTNSVVLSMLALAQLLAFATIIMSLASMALADAMGKVLEGDDATSADSPAATDSYQLQSQPASSLCDVVVS